MPYKYNPHTGKLDYYEVSTGGGTGGGANLSFIPGINNGAIVSDTGTDAVIPLANATEAGLFSAVEKAKLAAIAAGAEVNVNADWNATSGDAQILNKPSILPSELIQQTVKASTALTKGTAVYVSDADGTNVIVGKASNATEALSSKTLGLIAQDLANNGIGTVITEGRLAGLDTSTAQVKDPVWLGTNGQLIFGLTNKPVAPAHLVYLGVVTRVNANNGEIFVKVQNGYELDELHDVLITNPLDGQILMRGNDGLWKNTTPLFLTGGGNNGYLGKYIGTYEQTNSAIYEDAGKIGIGTTTPLRKFHIKENSAAFAVEGTDHVYQEFYPQGLAAGRFGFIGYSQAGSGIFRFYNGPLGTDIDFVTDNQIRLVISKTGQVKINTVDAAATNTSKILVSDSGEIKYRTPAQILSDIGGLSSSIVGSANGVVPLNSSSKIDQTYLPSYVDDVLEYTNSSLFPATGETGKIYIALDTNITYRWGGSSYVEISSSLALGETSATAYRGDRGLIAYTHSQTTGNPHGTTKADLSLGNVPNVDATNPANIVQTSSYRFVTDAEKATWNAVSAFIPDLTGRETFRGVNYGNNSTTEVTSGGITMSTTGSVVARSVASTSYATKQIRKGFTASVVSAGRYTGTRGSALLFYIGGGFRYVCEVYISDTAYGSGCRQFYGLQSGTTDLTYTDTVLVASLLNCIGVGSDSADTNLQIFYNDATGTASKIDLGANFPANRTSGAALTTIYSIVIYNAPNSSSVLVQVTNKETGAVAQNTLTTDLPASTLGLNFFASRGMGAGITNTGQFDLSILGVYSI